jgi:chorismate mutase
LVKNPVNPDLALWIGAFERLLGQDVKNLEQFTEVFLLIKKQNTETFPIGKLL